MVIGTHVPRNRLVKALASAAVLMVAIGVAGCSGDTQPLEDNNNAPNARLETSKDTGWTGEHFSFDASGSEDSDGEITRWHLDFGDGTEAEYRDEDEARDASHTYKNGGEFTVTLTVTDDGGEQEGSKTDTATAEVVVNERKRLAAEVAYLEEANSTQVDRQEVPFDVNDGADSFEVDVTVESTAPTGGSEIVVRVLDPNGEKIAEERLTVDALDNETLNMQDVLTDTGNHTVEVEAESGSAAVHGELRIYYDATEMAQQ